MTDLKEDLDRVLRTVQVGMAPVEQAKHQGRRIRTRRRVTVLAGTLAVVAIAAGYPAFTKTAAAPAAKVTTSAKPTPATTPTNWPGTRDPVLTEGPGAKATHGSNGLVATAGVIAAGTLGNNRWQASISGIATCVDLSVTFAKGGAGLLADYCPGSGTGAVDTDAADPVTFEGSTNDGTNYAIFGKASKQVSYLEVTFTDGQSLKLTPVIVGGTHYFAWVAPESMTVASIDAHLGGPNDAPGLTEEAVPFDLPGQVPVVTGFTKPGQAVLPRVTKVIGHGTANGTAWAATAYLGPWGTCVVAGAGDTTCVGPGLSDGTEILGVPNPDATVGVFWGSAAPGTALVNVDGTATAKPIGVGPELLWACWVAGLGGGIFPGANSVTGYDAAGYQVGPSSPESATVTFAP
jgi:hypothetical protein